MFSKKRVNADADHFALQWSAVVMRFFQMFVGDQAVAEPVTIETLVEHFHSLRTASDGDLKVSLLRRAVAKALKMKVSLNEGTDPLLRALTRLEPNKRAAIVLWRGLSLDFYTTGQILGFEERHVRHVCMEALEELRTQLQTRTTPPPESGKGK